MNRYKTRLGVGSLLSLVLLLAACSGVPLTSYPKLMRLDPMSANPRDILIATRIHESVQTDHLRVTMYLKYQDKAADMTEDHEFEVVVSAAQFLTPTLADGAEPDDRTTILQLTPADAETLQGFQKRVREHREGGGEGQGEFTLRVRGFCFPQGEALDDKQLTLFLKTEPDSDFFVFLRRDLEDLAEEAGLEELADTTCQPEAGLQ